MVICLFVDEEFTGESFLLLDRPTCKELGFGIGGQLLVQKLVKEVEVCVCVCACVRACVHACVFWYSFSRDTLYNLFLQANSH